MNAEEKDSIVLEVGGWLWGTIQGGFNEQQSVSQILVDAVIGMIPLVGDVTAARDLIAVVLRMVDHPEKRKDWVEWMTLVVLLFALIPVLGGAVKGVGRLLIKYADDAARHLPELVALLNRIGVGDAVKYLKTLDFEKHVPDLMGKWRYFTQKLDQVLDEVLRKVRGWMPDEMVERLEALRRGLRELARLGDKMVPEALKELNRRLKLAQRALYQGEWNAIADNLTSASREVEARLVASTDGSPPRWEFAEQPFPPTPFESHQHVDGWPVLNPEARLNIQRAHPCREAPTGNARSCACSTAPRPSNPAGYYWAYRLPESGPQWRESSAVLDQWSKNGEYIEFIVPEEGLIAWEGLIASQLAATGEAAGQVLKGGAVQLVIDFTHPENAHALPAVLASPRKSTNWTGHLGLNLPGSGVTVQRLGHYEIESKMNMRAGRASVASAQLGTGTQEQPPTAQAGGN